MDFSELRKALGYLELMLVTDCFEYTFVKLVVRQGRFVFESNVAQSWSD